MRKSKRAKKEDLSLDYSSSLACVYIYISMSAVSTSLLAHTDMLKWMIKDSWVLLFQQLLCHFLYIIPRKNKISRLYMLCFPVVRDTHIYKYVQERETLTWCCACWGASVDARWYHTLAHSGTNCKRTKSHCFSCAAWCTRHKRATFPLICVSLLIGCNSTLRNYLRLWELNTFRDRQTALKIETGKFNV